jgi:hypothetical protein
MHGHTLYFCASSPCASVSTVTRSSARPVPAATAVSPAVSLSSTGESILHGLHHLRPSILPLTMRKGVHALGVKVDEDDLVRGRDRTRECLHRAQQAYSTSTEANARTAASASRKCSRRRADELNARVAAARRAARSATETANMMVSARSSRRVAVPCRRTPDNRIAAKDAPQLALPLSPSAHSSEAGYVYVPFPALARSG